MKQMKPAIAMLELIFSIVVMGLVLLSVPMLIQVSTQSGYVAIQQEGINQAASQINAIMGNYAWDEADTNNNIIVAPILTTVNGDPDLAEAGNSGTRVGVPPSTGIVRSFITALGARLPASAPNNFLDVGEAANDDIDDFNGQTQLVQIEAAANADYIEKGGNVNLRINVDYIPDAPAGGSYSNPGADERILFAPNVNSPASARTTNIKRIRVTLTSTSGVSELNKTITMFGFSSNIGEYQLGERYF